MKDFTQLAIDRHSVRKYTDQKVERSLIEAIVETCRIAPSANNSQPWKLTIVDEPELKQKVAEATYSSAIRFNKFALQAPVIAVITIEKPKLISQVGTLIKKREYSLIDIGIFASHFSHKAQDLGLGTCILGWFQEKEIKSLLGIPKNKRIGLVITLGYEQKSSANPKKIRKSTDQICSFNQY